jgi:hypothetical protein
MFDRHQIYANGQSAAPAHDMDASEIKKLVAELASRNWQERHHARQTLTALGKPAVSALTDALADPRQQMRWDAARILIDMGDPAAAPALALRLEDDDAGIRWLAAQGLAALGCHGIVVALRLLIARSDSVWMREGVHHILHSFVKTRAGRHVAPVLHALNDVEPALGALPAAQAALNAVLKETNCGN